MTTHKHYRSYDNAARLAGEPVGCLDPYFKPHILKESNGMLFGTVFGSDEEPMAWIARNGHAKGLHRGVGYGYDLVLLPVRVCHGKPIYLGNTMFDENGQQFQVEMAHVEQGDFLARCSWTKPAPVVSTRLTDKDLASFVVMDAKGGQSLLDIANYVIARAIADGDVVPVETHVALLRAVAERTWQHCVDVGPRAHPQSVFGKTEIDTIIALVMEDNKK